MGAGGARPPLPPCCSDRSELATHPLDGRPSQAGVLQGVANGASFSADEADRQLTAFSAKRGQRYRFEGRTSMDATSLHVVQPRIVVQPTGGTNEDEMVTTFG